MSRRRWAVLGGAALLGGVVLSWLVAWACAVWVPIQYVGARPSFVRPSDEQRWIAAVGGSANVIAGSERAGLDVAVVLGPRRRAPLVTRSSMLSIVRAGWPCRALEGELWYLDRDTRQSMTVAMPGTGFPLPPDARPVRAVAFDRGRLHGLPQLRLLPLRPRPVGLAVDAIVFAALLLLPFAVVAARRSIRRHRGRCPLCGYPAGAGDTCTE